MRRIMFGAVLVVVAGCETQPLVTQIGAGSYGSASGVSAPLSGEAAFAAQVARSRLGAPLETVSGNWTLRGINTGSNHGAQCQYVSVENINLHRTTHYSVCGGAVRERAGVAPTYPSGGDAERVRRSVIDSAWRYGQAEQQWEVYQISAVRVGPPHADGCARINATITYEGMLVRSSEERVCH